MKRRDLVRMSDAEVQEFLGGRRTMNVASFNHDGTIHLVAMWYGFVDSPDGEPLTAFWTYGRSQKILNFERNPKVTCLVEAGDQYENLQGVELVGQAEVVTDTERRMAIGRSVFERYVGPWSDEMLPYLEKTGAKRAGVIIHPERVVSWDHNKLEGGY